MNDGRHYVGITKDITRRIAQHNYGMNKTTRYHRPLVLVYLKDYRDYGVARVNEVSIKSQGVTRWYNKNVRWGVQVSYVPLHA